MKQGQTPHPPMAEEPQSEVGPKLSSGALPPPGRVLSLLSCAGAASKGKCDGNAILNCQCH